MSFLLLYLNFPQPELSVYIRARTLVNILSNRSRFILHIYLNVQISASQPILYYRHSVCLPHFNTYILDCVIIVFLVLLHVYIRPPVFSDMELDRKFEIATLCRSVVLGSLVPDQQYPIVHAGRINTRYFQSVLLAVLDSPNTSVKFFSTENIWRLVGGRPACHQFQTRGFISDL